MSLEQTRSYSLEAVSDHFKAARQTPHGVINQANSNYHRTGLMTRQGQNRQLMKDNSSMGGTSLRPRAIPSLDKIKMNNKTTAFVRKVSHDGN